MSAIPKIAIVGRPNVGKSALFNRICGKRIAIVDEAEGITRDRLYAQTSLFGRPFMAIDTGGIHLRSTALFNEEIRQQAEIAIEEGDGLIMVVDGHIGPTELDKDVARILLRKGKPLVLAVNKIDNYSQESLLHQFYCLGISKIISVSALQGRNIAELLQPLLSAIPVTQAEEASSSLKVAIIGRANVGKSTLVNRILDENRCIVSPIPGTTRDSIDSPFEIDGQHYTLIDTAGIRRKTAEREVVDKFAAIRTERAIERADVCVLMLDAKDGLTTQEKRIATTIEEAGKGCIILMNKWDLIKGFRMEHCQQALAARAPFLGFCPIIFGSAKTGRNVDSLLTSISSVCKERTRRIPTPELNRLLIRAMQEVHPPMITGKRLRIYYMTQIGTAPPRFLLFVNFPNLLTPAYKKYIYNQLRKVYPYSGNPIVFEIKGKERTKEEPVAHLEVERVEVEAESIGYLAG